MAGSLAQRQQERRRKLFEAGLELLGAADGPGVGVRAVCRHARLTERYFYENFADRDALVTTVYEDVAGRAHQALVDAVAAAPPVQEEIARAAVEAFVALVLDDPRIGRVLILAPLTDPALTGRGVAALPAFRALVGAQLPPEVDETARSMTAIGLVGALAQLFSAVLDGTLDVGRERLVAHCVQLVLRAAEPFSPGR